MKRLLLFAFALLCGTLVSDVNAAVYTLTVTVTNTSATSYTNLAVISDAGTPYHQFLINNSYIASTALDTNLADGTTTVQHMPVGGTPQSANRITAVIPSLPAGSNLNLTYSLGYSPALTQFPIIAGNGGSVSTADAAAIEPGTGTFEVEWEGYFDATKTGSVAEKLLAYGLRVDVGGTAIAYYASSNDRVETVRPSGAGGLTGGFTLSGCAAEWECAGSSNPAVNISNTGTTARTSRYAITRAFNDTVMTNTLQMCYVVTTAVANSTFNGLIFLGATTSNGAAHTTNSDTAVEYCDSYARPGGGTWSVSDLNSVQIGITQQGAGAGSSFTLWNMRALPDYDYSETTRSAAVGTGAHSLKATKSGTTLELFVDDVSQGTSSGASTTVVGNTQNARSSHNGPDTYTTFTKFTIAGTLIVWYEPVTIISGTTLPDRQGADQNGTLSFGSNPSDVSLMVSGLVVEPTTSLQLDPTANIIENSPGQSLATPSATLPGINRIEAAGIPGMVFWRFVTIVLILATGVFLIYKTQSIGFAALVMGFGFIIIAAMGIVPFWVPVLYGMLGFAYLLAQARGVF